MNKHYIDDDELTYEIILSKGKGRLTDKAFIMFDLIAKNIIKKKYFNSYQLQKDITQDGMLQMCYRYTFFDEEKYHHALPFFTEIFKRQIALSFNKWFGIKNNINKKNVSIDRAKYFF